jgi:hypothetical protein
MFVNGTDQVTEPRRYYSIDAAIFEAGCLTWINGGVGTEPIFGVAMIGTKKKGASSRTKADFKRPLRFHFFEQAMKRFEIVRRRCCQLSCKLERNGFRCDCRHGGTLFLSPTRLNPPMSESWLISLAFAAFLGTAAYAQQVNLNRPLEPRFKIQACESQLHWNIENGQNAIGLANQHLADATALQSGAKELQAKLDELTKVHAALTAERDALRREVDEWR